MSNIPPLKIELEKAIAHLRRPGNHHKYDRAALRLEKLSQSILNPQSKAKRPRAKNARLIGGSGKSYAIKINLEDQDL